MIYRKAQPGDYLQLAEMKWLHCQEDDADYGENNLAGADREAFLADFAAFLERNVTYSIYCACDGQRIASAMFAALIPKVPKPGRRAASIAYLTNVYTRKEYRNQGVGTALLGYIQDQLRAQDCELIFVWPSEKSVAWYRRNGFLQENEMMECPLGPE